MFVCNIKNLLNYLLKIRQAIIQYFILGAYQVTICRKTRMFQFNNIIIFETSKWTNQK